MTTKCVELADSVVWSDSEGQLAIYSRRARNGTVARGTAAVALEKIMQLLMSGAATQSEVVAATVGIVDEETTEELLRRLGRVGCLTSRQKVVDSHPSDLTVLIVCRQGVVPDQLRDTLREAGLDVHRVQPEQAQFRAEDFVVGLDLFGDPSELLDLNRRAVAVGAQSLMAEAGSGWLRLGPVTLPGESACWECDWLRGVTGGRAERPPVWIRTPLERSPSTPRFAAVVDLLAQAVLSGLGIQEPSAISRALDFRLADFYLARWPVLEVPNCAACSAAPLPEADE